MTVCPLSWCPLKLPEVLGMSDRVIVIHEGRVAGILDRSDATPESIMTLATGGQ